MATNRVACGGDLLEYLRMPQSVLADREECRLGALLGKRSKNGASIFRPRTVVKG